MGDAQAKGSPGVREVPPFSVADGVPAEWMFGGLSRSLVGAGSSEPVHREDAAGARRRQRTALVAGTAAPLPVEAGPA